MTDLTAQTDLTAEGPRWHERLRALLPVVLVLALYGGSITVVRASMPHVPQAEMAQTGPSEAAPVLLASLSPTVAAQYAFAAEHQHAYTQIPCYCGCDDFADHRHLYDCFVRTDGKGYDAHARGCAICLGEARMAEELLKRGRSPTVVRDAIVDAFGPSSFPNA